MFQSNVRAGLSAQRGLTVHYRNLIMSVTTGSPAGSQEILAKKYIEMVHIISFTFYEMVHTHFLLAFVYEALEGTFYLKNESRLSAIYCFSQPYLV